ncbi:MAG: polysaccharide deacetylase family protein [Spirochaetales bacterium]|nr:polysaccharide deacetylase family protein [Spirochaetales bacterium]
MDKPLISFTFDDIPSSAFTEGGAILRKYGLHATFYISLGLLGKETPTGKIISVNDLKNIVSEGHEIGCHTFSHLDAWHTNTKDFEEAIKKNRDSLETLLPGTYFRTLSYPIAVPKPLTKRTAGRYFVCCRGGGQTNNRTAIDFNLLKGYFIDKRNNKNLQEIMKMIDKNRVERGWLIFATHDIGDQPTPFGCGAGVFEKIVQYSIESGATILPVVKAVEIVQGHHM